jgi:KDO2-lipid IV(A) lauroyltransferase
MMYYVFRLVGLLAPRLPAGLGLRLAAALGDLWYHLARGQRAILTRNLRHVLGLAASGGRDGKSGRDGASEETIQRTARAVFRHTFRNYYDLFRLPHLPRQDVEKLIVVQGEEHLREALAAGRGAILATAHFGNVEIMSRASVFCQYQITAVAEHLQPERLYRDMLAQRSSGGVHLVPIDGSLKAIFRALHANQLVGLAADRDVSHSGITVPFFGAPANLPAGYVSLALRTGAPVLPIFIVRQPEGSFVIQIEPPLALANSGDRERAVRSGVAQMVAVLERYIGQYPEQWTFYQPIWDMAEQRA